MRATRRFLMALGLALAAGSATAQTIPQKPGWRVIETKHAFPALVQRAEKAIADNKMNIVNRASASEGAKAQGFTIPGNLVLGVYRNDFARRMLKASLAAGIEAPIRLYLTEKADGTATLSYRTPSTVFGPYFEGADADLKTVAEELDVIFAKIVDEAAQ